MTTFLIDRFREYLSVGSSHSVALVPRAIANFEMIPSYSRSLATVFSVIAAALACSAVVYAQTQSDSETSRLERDFKSPPYKNRPIASFEVKVLSADFVDRLKVVLDQGYGGFLFSPSTDPDRRPPIRISSTRPLGLPKSYPPEASKWLPAALPGEELFGSMVRAIRPFRGNAEPTPGYFTDEWFRRVEAGLNLARDNGRYATFYDEVGFPSGMANHTTPPKYYRKLLRRQVLTAGPDLSFTLPDLTGELQAVVAIERRGRRLDLTKILGTGKRWRAPRGEWQVEAYTVETAKSSGTSTDYYGAVDYLDAEAVDWYIDQTYGRTGKRLGSYFGNTLNMTFFDDIGFFPDEKTWGSNIGARFKALTGKDPASYYPALWRDIGPETTPARVAFFRARAELIGEGFPKRVSDWARANGLMATGHAAGQYDPQPTDMFGDPFLFYKAQDIPMVDAIFGHGYGREGFKLVSSAANLEDKPIVAAENFTAGPDEMGYRRTIELIVRGMNWFVTGYHALFQPVGEPSEFPEWIGRSSLMLQGARHVADVAIVYPIESLQAFYSFDSPRNVKGIPMGSYISNDHDYLAVGEMLTSEVHRDFTFIHPDYMGDNRLKVSGSQLVLDNKFNLETYRVVILPGGEVVSVATLRKLKAFYDAGGAILATSRLPFKSAQFGQDSEVQELVKAIFGVDPTKPGPAGAPAVRTNNAGGRSMFLSEPSVESLRVAFDSLRISSDVSFDGNPAPHSGNGVFGYIHKQRGADQVYFFGNSSADPIETLVTVRGRLNIELWDPHTGTARIPVASEKITRNGEVFTRARLRVEPLKSVIYVGQPVD